MGNPFRAGLERSWVLSWISWLRNHCGQRLALGPLPLHPLSLRNRCRFLQPWELPCGWAVSLGEGEREEEMELPSDRDRKKP